MRNNAVALPYADALFKAAINLSIQDQVKNDFLLIYNVFADCPELLQQFSSPSLTSEEKLHCILNTFSGCICNLSQDFFRVLIYRNRLGNILEISEVYNQLYDKYYNITNVKVISAFQLDNKISDYVYKTLKSFLGVNINIKFETDSGLLAGLKIIYDDKLIDFSVSSTLRHFRRQLSDKIAIKIKSRILENF